MLQQLSLYPNPNVGLVTIDYKLLGEENAIWKLYDVNGKEVMNKSLQYGTNQKQLNVSHLTNGIYHFSVTLDGDRLKSGKMVISKP